MLHVMILNDINVDIYIVQTDCIMSCYFILVLFNHAYSGRRSHYFA